MIACSVISWNMNKVMVMRASGGGNVIAYNYMEDGYIGNTLIWVEVGLNASHMTCPHYELFEGNESFNFDADNTWGNSVTSPSSATISPASGARWPRCSSSTSRTRAPSA